jgi:hypothetical protein
MKSLYTKLTKKKFVVAFQCIIIIINKITKGRLYNLIKRADINKFFIKLKRNKF